MRLCTALALVAASAGVARADRDPPSIPDTVDDAPAGDCHAALDAAGVRWEATTRPGIADAVIVTGPIAGVTYASTSEHQPPLVLDCSLVVSLAIAGRYITDLGIDHAIYSSAYQIRNVRGTNRRSKHSYGLALDVHVWSGPQAGTLSVERDFEQGQGDDIDCVGAPATEAGMALKILECQLIRSGLFYLVLNPDYDADHYNHYHLEARPWAKRPHLRATTPALH
ncbi:MAG: extensin family protein [Deltaproteobacteria bacterium]|nr:extensin family protein [Deltaproteobacteria bacterium]